MKLSVFDVKRDIENFGVWYAVHQRGIRAWWTIWVATRMIAREQCAVSAHVYKR